MIYPFSNLGTKLEAPVFTVNPVITGTPSIGQTLTCDGGTVTGTAPITKGYQWERNGVVFAGGSNQVVVPSGSLGETIVCRVFANNAAGSAQEVSNSVIIS